ncbi:DNA/RNA non-specific endonuclease [Nonomuraea salmonea]|uniref:DNA/RNA non-specific endonuclease n=1 Tax=Nonomuraea salmonea TaxID=46181 RepID=UPI002FECA076
MKVRTGRKVATKPTGGRSGGSTPSASPLLSGDPLLREDSRRARDPTSPCPGRRERHRAPAHRRRLRPPCSSPTPPPCARLLEASATYRAYEHTFTTDAAGRPAEAVAKTLVDRDAPRGSCEGKVGDWGGSGDWQGGHLIAASFRGASMRYNLVPMRGRQINQGLMKRVENGARACLEDGGEVRDYRVRLHYPDRTTLTPRHDPRQPQGGIPAGHLHLAEPYTERRRPEIPAKRDNCRVRCRAVRQGRRVSAVSIASR